MTISRTATRVLQLAAFLSLALAFTSVCEATSFYVFDRDGDDSRTSTQAQSRRTAWKTIQRAMDVAGPGDEVIVMNGRYEENVLFRRGGSAGAPLVLRAEVREGVRLIGSIASYGINYISVEGFYLTNLSRTGLTKGISLNGGHHVTVRNNRVRSCAGGGISIDQCDWILIEWNITHHNAYWDPAQHSGISVYQPQQRGEDSGYWGIQIRNNTSYSNLNRLDNVNFGRPTDGNGIVVDDFLNQQPGGAEPYNRPTVIENNLCFENGGQGIHCYLSQNVDIRNNTCVNNLRSFTFGGEITIGESNRVYVYNNILSPRPRRRAALQYLSSSFWLGFNIVDGEADGFSFDSTNQYTSPQFEPGSYELRANSPGVDDGLDVSGHYFLDLFGRNRFNGNIDIGAMERQ